MYYINDYPIDPNLNYLVYYRGNFGPPTRGHLSLVEHLSEYSNVKYFIHQIGGRHGFPYKLNRKIFKIYLKPYDRITLEPMNSSLRVLDYIENVDRVILIKGGESPEPLINGEGEEIYQDLRRRYSPLDKELRKRGVKLDFLFVDRPLAETVSATKFTQTIEKYRRNPSKAIAKCRDFVPKSVSENDYRYIIKKLCQSSEERRNR